MLHNKFHNGSQRIHLFDGYQSLPVWKETENRHMFFDVCLEREYTVPIRSMEILKKELEII